ncbi:CRISPR-associated Cse3 family protein [Enterobacter sp. BIGb0383]|uniref:type I-E CRISPR-associated protein Cas6/Cse3/CasE n=1 Tax=unclassified Enterobacter TaxID=2608935 RepID=UPI000F483897|nr:MULTISPECIES: type I-E CRISPR-associated protein Cas6/Cse3/CasE [unclassified Enterobacter]ROP59515.1 CRISPR-associated Cse3 family protein [Enterobacter sp. BIGb0383]ROS09017.1 CRISPR-associated Cse3 family protein [Enterobacter sp. BIGb0359]
MYLSRIQLRLENLTPQMLEKWQSAMPYASHQWLWQLFPEHATRPFLFRQEPKARFFVLSDTLPLSSHTLFDIETKPFTPQLEEGMVLAFQLRANPVITRKAKRYDVMMDAKFQAKLRGEAQDTWWDRQLEAAQLWLEKQGLQHGFRLQPSSSDEFDSWAGTDDTNVSVPTATIDAYQQHRFMRPGADKSIMYSSVDYSGVLEIINPSSFEQALFHGIGKSKGLGCGMLMVKRRR